MGRRRSRARITGILGAVACVTSPLPTSAADLLEIYHLARTNDPVFLSAQHTLEATRQKVPEAFSAMLPNVAASASGGWTRGDTLYTDTPRVTRGFNQNMWTIQLTQPIFRLQNNAAYGEARALADQATAIYDQAEEDLILRTAEVYFDVLIAREAVSAADAHVKAAEEQQAAAEHGYRAGTGALTDVYEARARADQARSDQLSAVNDLDGKRAALEQIIDEAPPELAGLRDGVSAPRPDPEKVESWVARARQDNAQVRAASAAVRAAQARVERARRQRLPNVDLVASVGRSYSSGNITNPTDYATNVTDREIGLQITVPLLDGGGMRAATHEAVADAHKADADLEAAVRKAATDAKNSYQGVIRGLAQVQALQSAVESGENSVVGNRRGYELGIRINSDVLGAQQELYAARRDLAKARYEALLQGLHLKAAAGALGLTDLSAVNALLTGREREP